MKIPLLSPGPSHSEISNTLPSFHFSYHSLSITIWYSIPFNSLRFSDFIVFILFKQHPAIESETNIPFYHIAITVQVFFWCWCQLRTMPRGGWNWVTTHKQAWYVETFCAVVTNLIFSQTPYKELKSCRCSRSPLSLGNLLQADIWASYEQHQDTGWRFRASNWAP